jgi:glycosyltransferase involved in cell wall biosynthesis
LNATKVIRIIAALPLILGGLKQFWVAEGQRIDLRRLAKKLSVEDHIRFQAIPPEDREVMAQELSRASLVVLLSEYETQPIAILEALSLGRPALVTNSSGLGELCDMGLTKGIPVDSTSEQVAEAVLEQLRSPLIPTKIDLPTWADCTKGLIDLYNAILTRNH